MARGLKIEGFKELEKNLLRLKTSTAKATVRRAMKKSLEPFVAEAKRQAPVDDGWLAESITIGTKLTKNQAREQRGQIDKNTTTVMYAGAGARHAHLIEFGTGPRYHNSGKYVGSVSPQPFMRPAWDATKRAVLMRFTEQMREEVAKSVARAARKAAREAS
jgi:HK97 gp10 family phage protein